MIRYLLSFALAAVVAVPALAQVQVRPAQPAQPAQPREVKPITVKGRIVKIQGTDSYVVRTADNKEVPFYVNQSTRYWIDRNAAKYGDFKEGTEATIIYVTDRDRNVVQQVYTGAEPPQQPQQQATFYEGEIIKVVGEDQVIVRTADNKEVTVYVTPQTTYTFDNKAARFTDLRPGTSIRVDYDLRERRPVARTIRNVVRPRR